MGELKPIIGTYPIKIPAKTIEISLHNIIMEFTRKSDERTRVREVLPSMDVVLKFNPEAIASNEGISLQPKEWKILSLVNGNRTVREIANL